MIDTLLNDLIEHLAEPFSTEVTVDWYLRKAFAAFQSSKTNLVDALTEQRWLERVLSGEVVPKYSTLYEKFRCLEFFDRLSPADQETLLRAHRQTSDAAHRILREEEEAIQILYLFRDCLTTFGAISDPHPPIGYFVQVVRTMLEQNRKLDEQFTLLAQFNLSNDSRDTQATSALLNSELNTLIGSIDVFEKQLIDFLKILDGRISKALSAVQQPVETGAGGQKERKTLAGEADNEERVLDFSLNAGLSSRVSEEALRKLLLSMDLVQRLQADQEEDRLLWQARANVAKKKKRHELAEAALARSAIHERRAKLHSDCLSRVKQCVQRIRDLPRSPN